MPLIEIVTYPDMHTPAEAGRVLWMLHKLTRSTGKVRRGIGSTRQDVNVSIMDGPRVEIKGVPQIWRVVESIHYEAIRQKALLDIRDELHARGIDGKYKGEAFDATEIFAKTANPHIRGALDEGGMVRAIRLDGFAGLIKRPTGPGATFQREFAGRVRVIACLDGKPNLFSTDEWPEYEGGQAELDALKKLTGAKLSDAVLIVWGNEADTKTAADEIEIRGREATMGVPNETRQIMADCTTDFERILPGPDRMYPDTDSPPCRIVRDRIDAIDAAKPAPPWERLDHYRELGLNEQVAGAMLIDPLSNIFDTAADEIGVPAKLAAEAIVCTIRGMKRKGLPMETVKDEDLIEMFKAVREGNLYREGIPAAIKGLATGKPVGYTSLDEADIQRAVQREIEAGGFDFHTADHSEEKRVRHYIGRVMKMVAGRAPGVKVVEAVRKQLNSK